MKLKQAIISFWYKELEYNPICKVNELENGLSNYFNKPFLINNQEPFINIGMPRIVATSENNYSFNMSLVNANLIINLNDLEDIDNMILSINEMMQLIYDLLIEVYDLDIIYTSIKIEISEFVDNKEKIQKDILISRDNYEDFLVKTSICKDDKYYINKTISLVKEIKVDIKLPKNAPLNDNDMLTRTMLVSIDNNTSKDVKNSVLEINNRLHYNKDDEFIVKKSDIRDLLYEFKLLLKDELGE